MLHFHKIEGGFFWGEGGGVSTYNSMYVLHDWRRLNNCHF